MKTHCLKGHPLVEGNLYPIGKKYRKCRSCALERSRIDYQKNAEHYKAYHKEYRKKNYVHVKARVAEIRAYINQVRDKCIKCGETHPACLDFHHRNPEEKAFKLTAPQIGNRSWTMIKAEVAKCDVLCSNCHRKHHHDKRQEEKSL